MAIHSVLLSASSMRLGPPGTPSLMGMGLPAVLLLRLTTVRLPANSVWPLTCCGCWPATYMVEESTRALLAPPGMAKLVMGVVCALAQGAALQGSRPDA